MQPRQSMRFNCVYRRDMDYGSIGKPRVTSADVAALAGVSQSTVSYVMTGKRTISDETRERVLAAMKKLGFQPNAGARALAGRRSNVIGLLIRLDTTTDMEGTLPFIDTITRVAREFDYDVVLVTGEDGAAEMERLAGRSVVDAIILMDIRDVDPRLDAASELGVPVVLIGVPRGTTLFDAFDFDVTAAAELAVEELVRDGADHITLVGEPPAVSSEGYGFIRGFEESAQRAAESAGLPLHIVRPPVPGVAGFHAVADQLLSAPGRAGIIARAPQVVSWTLHHLSSLGVTPGVDVGLVGLCTDEAATAFTEAVTNVSPEPRAVSRAAVERLVQRLAGIEPARTPRATLLPPRLTRRATTRGHE